MSVCSRNYSWNLEDVLARLARKIDRPLNIMEICGTHTVALMRFGFKSYFKGKINFLSGPGCPVCVTAPEDIDRVVSMAERGAAIVTFGDLLRVPGSRASLAAKRAQGCGIHVVYTPLEALRIAGESGGETVFVAIGFETTAPLIAALLEEIVAQRVENLSIYPLLKTIPGALAHLLAGLRNGIDGLICPGHVSAIIGMEPYAFIPERFGLPCAITGFEREDIAAGLLSLIAQIEAGRPAVDNRYGSVVRSEGNPLARAYLDRYFRPVDADWRGLGEIPGSGLGLRPEYAGYDARARIAVEDVKTSKTEEGCLCAEIICGLEEPHACGHFDRDCTPARPLGPCMVSSEGSCHAAYLYDRD